MFNPILGPSRLTGHGGGIIIYNFTGSYGGGSWREVAVLSDKSDGNFGMVVSSPLIMESGQRQNFIIYWSWFCSQYIWIGKNMLNNFQWQRSAFLGLNLKTVFILAKKGLSLLWEDAGELAERI